MSSTRPDVTFYLFLFLLHFAGFCLFIELPAGCIHAMAQRVVGAPREVSIAYALYGFECFYTDRLLSAMFHNFS